MVFFIQIVFFIVSLIILYNNFFLFTEYLKFRKNRRDRKFVSLSYLLFTSTLAVACLIAVLIRWINKS
jgi:hypothetical protein